MSNPPEGAKPNTTPVSSDIASLQQSPLSNRPSSLPEKPPSETRTRMVVIAVVSTAAFIICIVGHFSSLIPNFSRTKEVIEAAKNVFEMGAIVGGGAWAYFKFIKGRTFKESLVPAVAGKFSYIDDVLYLIVTTQIKNVGLSKIEFDRNGSALIVFEYNSSSATEIHTVAENRLTAFDVLDENDRYIEPSEIIEDQRFIAVPGPLKIAYRLEVQIASTAGYTWRTASIVDKSSLSDRITKEP